MEPEELIAMANRERWVGMTEWRVDAFSTLHQRGKKHYSDVFRVGDCPWRLSLYPRGNAAVGPKNRDQVALYLEAADAGSAPEGWRRHVDFKLEICHEVRANPATPRATAETADDTRHNPSRFPRGAAHRDLPRARPRPSFRSITPHTGLPIEPTPSLDVILEVSGRPRPTPTDPDDGPTQPLRRAPGRQSRLPAPRVARSTLTSSTPLAHAPHPSHSSIPRSLAGPVSLGVAQRDARVQLGHERRHVGFLAVFHPPPPRIGPWFPRRRRGDRPRIRPRQLAPRRRHGGSRRVHQDDPPRSA